MKPLDFPDLNGLFWVVNYDEPSNKTLVRIYETDNGLRLVSTIWNSKEPSLDVTFCTPLDDWFGDNEPECDWYGPLEGPETEADRILEELRPILLKHAPFVDSIAPYSTEQRLVVKALEFIERRVA